MNRTLRLSLALALVLAAGCAPARKSPETMPVVTPPPSVGADPASNPGSLFDPGQAEMYFVDSRARRVGDIVTVNVVESSKAKHKADTTADKDSSVDIGVSSFFNQSNVGPFGPVGTTPLVKAGTKTGLTATGETKRESQLTAAVGARVVRVLSGNVLQVEGAREMRINDETQILVIRGLIRPEDIGPDNTVSSDNMADAKIEYYGEGVLADKQKPGWLTRILDNVWPF